jgi:hypothetical protein
LDIRYKLLGFCRQQADASPCQFGSDAAVAAGALDFFRLLTIIVINGTSTVGSTLFRG